MRNGGLFGSNLCIPTFFYKKKTTWCKVWVAVWLGIQRQKNGYEQLRSFDCLTAGSSLMSKFRRHLALYVEYVLLLVGEGMVRVM